MNLFTANQVNHVYVAKRVRTGANAVAQEGDIKVHVTDAGIYFEHYGKGGITRSDLINPDTITYIKDTPASEMAKDLKSAFISLNSEATETATIDGQSVNVVKPAGEDFILRLAFSNYIGISPEDTQYLKYGVVHATANMTTDEFYFKLAKSIVTNMSRESVDFIEVYLTKANSGAYNTAFSNTTYQEKVTASSTSATLTGIGGITIAITAPDWILGLKQQKPMEFEVSASPVSELNTNGTYDEVFWADIIYNNKVKYTGGSDTPTKSIATTNPYCYTLVNSKLAADYEYFWHGERGDQYRLVNWPDYVPTEYMVDPTSAYGYDFITMHYYYAGLNEDVQKSGKDITFICPREVGDSTPSAIGSIGAALKGALANIPKVAKVIGATTADHKPEFDANGNLVDSGS